jgi:hypothetical protein
MQHTYRFLTTEEENSFSQDLSKNALPEILHPVFPEQSTQEPDEAVVEFILNFSRNLEIFHDSRNRKWDILKS